MLLSAVTLHAEVTITFDNDMQGFESLEGWGEPGSRDAFWSANYGGTLGIMTTGDEQWAAGFRTSGGPFFNELRRSMTNGGTLSFDVIVDSAGLPAGEFQLGIAADGEQSSWNELTLFSVSHADVQGGPVTVPVSIPIRPSPRGFSPPGTLLEGFEGYADSAALNADVFNATANATVTLGSTTGIGGSQALHFAAHNGNEPWYGQISLNVAGFSLEGLQDVNLAVSFLGGSNETFQVALLDSSNGEITSGPLIGTQSISANPEFDTYTIGVAGLTDTVAAIRFTFHSGDFGATEVAIDNITAVSADASPPEPSEPATLFFSSDETRFEFFLGQKFGSAGESTVYLDNFSIRADADIDFVKLTFDEGTEGFYALDWDPAIPRSVTHSEAFGGTLLLNYGIREEPWDPSETFDPWIAMSTMGFRFSQGINQAVSQGGVISFDLIAETGVLSTFAPRVVLTGDSWAEWNGPAACSVRIEPLGGGYERARISIPLSAFAGLSDAHYSQIGFGAIGEFWDTGLSFYLDNLSIEGAQPAVAITFDEDAEGFHAYFDEAFPSEPEVAHSTELGGHLEVVVPATSGVTDRWLFQTVMSPRFQVSLNRTVREGGEVRFDLIADTGVLAGIQPRLFIVQSSGDFVWSEYTAPAIEPSDLVSLGGGKEVVQIVVPANAISDLNTDAPYTTLGFGAIYDSATPLTIGIDNIVTLPWHSSAASGSVLTFASSLEGFSANSEDSQVNRFARPDNTSNMALFVAGPSGKVWHALATLGDGGATTAATEFGSNLSQASRAGGSLSFEVVFDHLSVREPTGDFDGINVTLAIYSDGNWQEQEFAFDDVDLPLASGTAVRTVTVPLYPTGSTEADGFVLEPSGHYTMFIGSNSVEGSAERLEFFVDDISITANPSAQPPVILDEPRLDLSGGIVYGRLLAAYSDGAIYEATGLPPGVTIDSETGLISGTPTATGTFNVAVTVTTAHGQATANYQWQVPGDGPIELIVVGFSHSNGTFTIQWTGNDGAPVNVERSTDLINWIPIATGRTGTSYTDFSPPAGRAFYRVVFP